MLNPFKKIKFKWFMTRRRDGNVFQGESSGMVFPLLRLPVYVPVGSARQLRKGKRLMKRATRLAEDLHDALLDLQTLKENNERYFTSQAKSEEPPEQTAPKQD
jgi:hypothetical protein